MEISKIELEIAALLRDDSKTKDEKVSELLKMHEDARALQRAATESGMVGNDDGNALREIDLALQKMGFDPKGPEDNGAATL